MTTHHESVCWNTVLKLQQKMASCEPGSFWYDVYDHAIELLLSGNRADDPFAMRNAVRDAKTTVRRRKQRRHQTETVELDATAADAALARVDSDPVVVANRPSPTDDQLAAKEAVSGLFVKVNDLNPYAAGVLNCWINGESLSSTAEQLKISAEYVKKLRKMVRSVANDLRSDGEAA